MPPFAIIWWLRKNYNTLKTYWSAEAETRSVTSGKTDQLLAECVVRWAGICSKDNPLTDAIMDRISFDSYKIPIMSLDPEKDISMREVYGLDPSQAQ